MSEMTCPWCEAALELPASEQHECPECLTTWSYEDEAVELALAA